MITVNITGKDFDVKFSTEEDDAANVAYCLAYAMNAIVDHVGCKDSFKAAFEENLDDRYFPETEGTEDESA